MSFQLFFKSKRENLKMDQNVKNRKIRETRLKEKNLLTRVTSKTRILQHVSLDKSIFLSNEKQT
jgi:hypothetical protein